MEKLKHAEVLLFLIQVSVLLISSRVLGEVFRKLKQPAVIGEILAGLLLGPSVLGHISPDVFKFLFYSEPKAFIAFDGLARVGVIFLLFVAGLEVDLPMIWKQGRSSVFISLSGVIFPFALGFTSSWFFYDYVPDITDNSRFVFSLFFGVALSISALPVIAKILLDLELIRTKVGGLILASAMVDDVLGWVMFSVILSLIGSGGESSFIFTILSTIGFTIILLSVGRIAINRILPIINRYFSWPGGVITFAIGCCFLGAVSTEYLGIHAIFGAFLMGICFGDSEHFTEKTREIINHFITNIFAPLFFVSIGLKVNFIENFDLQTVAFVVVVAYIAKVVGVGFGAFWSGLSKQESLAIGFGMNARGAMEIILGLLALEAGVINEKMFVALVVMAIITSITSGPLMKWALSRK